MLRAFGAVITVSPLAKTAERRFSEKRSVVTVEGPAWVTDNPAAAELAAICAVETEHQTAA